MLFSKLFIYGAFQTIKEVVVEGGAEHMPDT